MAYAKASPLGNTCSLRAAPTCKRARHSDISLACCAAEANAASSGLGDSQGPRSPPCKAFVSCCRRQKRDLSEPRSRTRPKSAAAATADGRVVSAAKQAAPQEPASGAGSGRDSGDARDSYVDSRGRKRRRVRAPPLPEAHVAPDGRKLSQLSRAEAQALLAVRLHQIPMTCETNWCSLPAASSGFTSN